MWGGGGESLQNNGDFFENGHIKEGESLTLSPAMAGEDEKSSRKSSSQ